MNNVFKQVVIVAAEIIVKSCSCVLLGLLTTGKADSYVTMAAVHQILTKSARLRGPDRNVITVSHYRKSILR